MTDARIQFVSLVDRPANKRPFLLKKAKGKSRVQTPILKTDDETHYVTGVVYEPDTEDSDGDRMSAKEIEKAAHWYMLNGRGVRQAAKDIMDSPLKMPYSRARRVALTEMLRAHSYAQQEAMLQTPSITHKIWRHTGFGLEPRENHAEMNGQKVEYDKPFILYPKGSNKAEHPMIPRDTNLPAGESVNCHCFVQPVADEAILGYSLEERQKMQAAAIAEDDGRWEKELDAKAHQEADEWRAAFLNAKIASPNYGNESEYKKYLENVRFKGKELEPNEKALLDLIPKQGDWVYIQPEQANIDTLAILTAHTGDEFAIFAQGEKKILAHGSKGYWQIPKDLFVEIQNRELKWTGHSHPTTGKLEASPEDRETLRTTFTRQQNSTIIDLEGKQIKFTPNQFEDQRRDMRVKPKRSHPDGNR